MLSFVFVFAKKNYPQNDDKQTERQWRYDYVYKETWIRKRQKVLLVLFVPKPGESVNLVRKACDPCRNNDNITVMDDCWRLSPRKPTHDRVPQHKIYCRKLKYFAQSFKMYTCKVRLTQLLKIPVQPSQYPFFIWISEQVEIGNEVSICSDYAQGG